MAGVISPGLIRTVNPATEKELAGYEPFDADRIEQAVNRRTTRTSPGGTRRSRTAPIC